MPEQYSTVFYANNTLFKEATSDNGVVVPILGTSLAVPPGYIYNGTMNCTSTSSTVVNCNSVVCWANSGATITVPSSMQKNVAQTWVIGTGGGLAPGINATTLFANVSGHGIHAHAIINHGVHDIYFDSSPIAANAPAGTTAYRRIGSVYVPGTKFIYPFIQFGDRFDYITQLPVAGTYVGGGLFFVGIPSGIRVVGIYQVFIFSANNGNLVVQFFDDPFIQQDRYSFETGSSGTVTGSGYQCTFEIPTDYFGNIWSGGASGSGNLFNMQTNGYLDRRGQDGDI